MKWKHERPHWSAEVIAHGHAHGHGREGHGGNCGVDDGVQRRLAKDAGDAALTRRGDFVAMGSA